MKWKRWGSVCCCCLRRSSSNCVNSAAAAAVASDAAAAALAATAVVVDGAVAAVVVELWAPFRNAQASFANLGQQVTSCCRCWPPPATLCCHCHCCYLCNCPAQCKHSITCVFFLCVVCGAKRQFQSQSSIAISTGAARRRRLCVSHLPPLSCCCCCCCHMCASVHVHVARWARQHLRMGHH